MRSFCYLFFFLFTSFCYGQKADTHSPLVLYNISENNGLSDDHVKCVLKDRENFIWIGTPDGLNVMDGSTVKIFRHKEGDSTSLPSSEIIAIAEDPQADLLYFGTSKGLSIYNKRTKFFTSYRPPVSPYGTSLDMESIIAGKNNELWCATDGGLFLFKQKEKKFIPFYNNSTEEGSDAKYTNRLSHMVADSLGRLWICSGDGLWCFDISHRSYRKIIHKNNDPYYHPLCLYVYVDHEQNVWAGFWNTGLKKYDTHSGKIVAIEHKKNNDHTVSYINELKQPNGDYVIWINGSLEAFDERKNSYFKFQASFSGNELPSLNPLYQSSDGWIWLGSDKGLFIYNPQRQLFNQQVFEKIITSQGVSFHNYKNGLLTGAEKKDFLKMRAHNGELIQDFSDIGNNSALLCIQQRKADDFWFGTSEGILHADLATQQREWFKHKDGDSTTIPRDFVPCLFLDSKDNLWVFPWREGIWQINKQTGKCRKLLEGFLPELNRTKRLVISDAAEDRHGNIWMTDLDEGIILYNAKTKEFSKPFEKELGPRYGTARIFIKNNIGYSFTSSAILKWNIDSDSVQRIHLPAEMDKGLTDMYPDQLGNWWMTSRNGLIVYNEKENVFNRFTRADGLAGNDINGTIFCASDGTMWIGTPGYFTSFDPRKLIQSSVSKKKMAVTEILVNNKQIDYEDNAPISLSYRENNLVIRWALPDFGSPFRNQYYVKLKGIDESWRYVGNIGEVQYANLSPGNYSIQLKAATANGVASANDIDLKFVIHPPVWKTWWFIALISAILVTVFIFVIRYISQRNLKEQLLRLEKEQAVEKERNRISRDMHDDLGSGLTKIAILSEVVKKQIHEPEKAKQQLENISESSRELVDNLQDIIWVLNPQNDTLESLAAYIREYALKFFEPFETDIHFDYPSVFAGLRLSEETRRNLFLVIKETFNNIAKHAWCNKVMVSINQASKMITIKIRDDGRGFDRASVRQFGNGLINMSNRIEQIGGTYSIVSSPGNGSQTEINVPVN